MARYKEEKLGFLLELINIDPNLLLLASAVGMFEFGKLLKTFSGMTITFPTSEKLKKIIRRAKSYRRSLKKILRVNGKRKEFKQAAALGVIIDSKDVRKAVKHVITQTVFQEYIRSLYEEDSSLNEIFTPEDTEELNENDKLKLYELTIQELEHRVNLISGIQNVVQKAGFPTK